jgi:hypothetical protein
MRLLTNTGVQHFVEKHGQENRTSSTGGEIEPSSRVPGTQINKEARKASQTYQQHQNNAAQMTR